jgi:hypothetical protein
MSLTNHPGLYDESTPAKEQQMVMPAKQDTP